LVEVEVLDEVGELKVRLAPSLYLLPQLPQVLVEHLLKAVLKVPALIGGAAKPLLLTEVGQSRLLLQEISEVLPAKASPCARRAPRPWQIGILGLTKESWHYH
jgi:hypothetical protein